MKHDRFDLESELRASRSGPRADFETALAGEVRGASGRARQSRIGLMVALAGLIIVAVASFGGVGYASSQKPAVVVKQANSAAAAQYRKYTPKAKAVAKAKIHAQAAGQTKTAPQKTTSQLPFTGLTLWMPLSIGLLLIAFGLALRTRGRRRGPAAH